MMSPTNAMMGPMAMMLFGSEDQRDQMAHDLAGYLSGLGLEEIGFARSLDEEAWCGVSEAAERLINQFAKALGLELPSYAIDLVTLFDD